MNGGEGWLVVALCSYCVQYCAPYCHKIDLAGFHTILQKTQIMVYLDMFDCLSMGSLIVN